MKASRILVILIALLISADNLRAQVTVMPLGDSITRGSGDPEVNGFRRDLWELLRESGYYMDFVGSLEGGTFEEKQHEGHSGWTDDQIAANVYNFLNANPAKIILLHIGTNSLDESPAQVEAILDEIDRWENENSRSVIVILAKIINRRGHVCSNPSTTTTFNSNVETMASGRINDRIVIVDMECGAGLDYQSDMADTLHPNAAGYAKMAYHWYAAGFLAVLPWADAGEDQEVAEGDVVTLDGSNSHDPDGAIASVKWEQVGGISQVSLATPNRITTVFAAPSVDVQGDLLTFKLTITDNEGLVGEDSLNIKVNWIPFGGAGPGSGSGGGCFIEAAMQ